MLPNSQHSWAKLSSSRAHGEPSQVESNRAEPNQAAEASRAKLGQAEPMAQKFVQNRTHVVHFDHLGGLAKKIAPSGTQIINVDT